jgi:ATP-binding cassette subfamily B protein
VSQNSLSVLNIGQNLIISGGVVIAMVLAANEVLQGRQSVGDFIM